MRLNESLVDAALLISLPLLRGLNFPVFYSPPFASFGHPVIYEGGREGGREGEAGRPGRLFCPIDKSSDRNVGGRRPAVRPLLLYSGAA